MAEVPPARGAGRKPAGNLLTRKYGPLPAWAWGALAALGVVVVMRRRAAAATSAAGDAADGTDDTDGTDVDYSPYDTGYTGGYDEGDGGGSGGGGDSDFPLPINTSAGQVYGSTPGTAASTAVDPDAEAATEAANSAAVDQILGLNPSAINSPTPVIANPATFNSPATGSAAVAQAIKNKVVKAPVIKIIASPVKAPKKAKK